MFKMTIMKYNSFNFKFKNNQKFQKLIKYYLMFFFYIFLIFLFLIILAYKYVFCDVNQITEFFKFIYCGF